MSFKYILREKKRKDHNVGFLDRAKIRANIYSPIKPQHLSIVDLEHIIMHSRINRLFCSYCATVA